MSALDNYRAQHPEYGGIGDIELANALYKNVYADKMPRAEFDKRIGLPSSQLAVPPNPMMASPKAGPTVIPTQASEDLHHPMLDVGGDFGGTEAALHSGLKDIPLVGAPAASSAEWLGNLLGSTFGDEPYNKVRDINEEVQKETDRKHPTAAAAGGLAGGALGYGAMAATAPELFGTGGATLPIRAGISAATNAGIAGGDTAIRGGGLADVGKSAAVSGILGAAAPVAGKIIGAGVRAPARMFSNWFSPGVPGLRKSAANALADALASDSAINNPVQTLQKMGPEGSIADVGPASLGWAQGVTALKATPKGEGRSLLFGALKQRDKGSAGRVLSTLDTEFGPAGNSPVAETKLDKAQKLIEAQGLPAALSSAPPVDASQALASIGAKLNNLTPGGVQAKALGKIQSLITEDTPKGPKLITDANKLHDAKQNIDLMIKDGDPGLGIQKGAISGTEGAVASIRKMINQALRDQVPNYGDIMDKLASLNRQIGQIKSGTEIFKGGNEPVHPQDLAAELANLPPEELAAKRFGARAAVDARIRTNPNDRLALKGVVGDPEDFKRQNLAAIFGGPQTENVASRAEAEGTMFGTKHNVVDNSQTEPRQEAVKMANPEMASHGIGLGVAALHPEAAIPYAGLKGAEASIKAASRAFSKRRNMEIARALLPRSDAASLAQSLLAHGARREVAGQSSGKAASDLARALLGYEGAVRKGQDRPSLDTVKRSAALGVGVPLAIWQNLP